MVRTSSRRKGYLRSSGPDYYHTKDMSVPKARLNMLATIRERSVSGLLPKFLEYEIMQGLFLLWIYHRFIVITQIGDRAFLAARSIEDANALPMAQ